MTLWQEYVLPTSVDDALSALTNSSGSTAVMAGGTDLLLDMQAGRHPNVHTIVDISEVAEMQGIRREDDHIYIGAAVTHNEIIENDLINEHAQCLVEGCSLIGGPQVRNVATLGGNVAHALPAGDGTIAMVSLGAEGMIAGPDGNRWLPILELFEGPGVPTFDRHCELLVGFRIPTIGARTASAFQRITRPQGVAIAILNMSVALECDDAGVILTARLAAGPAGRTPFEAVETSKALVGKTWNKAAFAKVEQVLLDETSVRTSKHRATEEYRRLLLPVLLKRAVDLAYARACNND
jgi:carbon-monoxide dehydrogenase medium subunit